MKLKVLTLNCWGIFVPYACKLRSERMKAIGEYLSTFDCNVVSLQEVWSKNDYHYLKNRLLSAFPYSFYFYSGCYGSGVCIFSRHEILYAHKHTYTINGYAHRIFQSDYYGGKLVGLVKIRFNDMIINFYATHMHAQYSEEDLHYNAYSHHRTHQAFELARYISLTSLDCDLVIAVGDINHRPDQLGYKILTNVGRLVDAWPEDIATCDRPDNAFCSPSKKFPLGVKLDYIFYRQNKDAQLKVLESGLEMRKIPGRDFNFSDHEGVFAIFSVDKIGKKKKVPTENLDECQIILKETISMLNHGDNLICSSQYFYFVISVIAFLFLVTIHFQSVIGNPMSGQSHLNKQVPGQSDLDNQVPDQSDFSKKVPDQPTDQSSYESQFCPICELIKFVLEIILTLFTAFGIWHSCIILYGEKNILKEAAGEIRLMIDVNEARLLSSKTK